MTTLRDAALSLAAKGLAVFPLRPKTKEPYADDKFYRTVGGYKCATRDPALVEFWWDRHPDNNIAVATGGISAIWVLDVDGHQGRETLATLEEQHGQLPPTVEVITPGKINKTTGEHTGRGLHFYYRYPLGLDVRNAQDRDDVPGLDWRGNGGYVCAPPSLHPDGGNYAWSTDSADSFADAPEWLLDLVTNNSRAAGVAVEAASFESWRSSSARPTPAVVAATLSAASPVCCCAVSSTRWSPSICCACSTPSAVVRRWMTPTSSASSPISPSAKSTAESAPHERRGACPSRRRNAQQ